MNTLLRASKYLLLTVICVFVVACGNNQQAVKPGETVIPQLPVSSTLQRQYDAAVSLLEQQDYTAAVTAFQAIIEQNKQLSGPYLNLGLAYWQQALQTSTDDELKRQAHINEAEAALTKAASMQQALSPLAAMHLGMLYRYTGRFEAAKKAYDQAIAEQPQLAQAYKNRAVLCDIYLQDFTCAANSYQRYRDIENIDDEQLNLWIADARRRAGLPSEEELRAARQAEAAANESSEPVDGLSADNPAINSSSTMNEP